MLSGKIKPLYNDEILAEYFDVLSRSKFHLSEIRINELLYFIKQNGIDSSRFPYDGEMPDEDDRVFYEVCLTKEDSFFSIIAPVMTRRLILLQGRVLM